MSELGKGAADHPIARYSLADRVIVTYDDDFVLEVDEELYRAVLYFDDATLSVKQVADIIQAVSQNYPQAELREIKEKASRFSAGMNPTTPPQPTARRHGWIFHAISMATIK